MEIIMYFYFQILEKGQMGNRRNIEKYPLGISPDVPVMKV